MLYARYVKDVRLVQSHVTVKVFVVGTIVSLVINGAVMDQAMVGDRIFKNRQIYSKLTVRGIRNFLATSPD